MTSMRSWARYRFLLIVSVIFVRYGTGVRPEIVTQLHASFVEQ